MTHRKLPLAEALAEDRILTTIDKAIDLADGDFPPTQGTKKRWFVFRYLNMVIDIPGLPEEAEAAIATVLDKSLEVIPSLIRLLVQARYDRKKSTLKQRRRKRQWKSWYDSRGNLLEKEERAKRSRG